MAHVSACQIAENSLLTWCELYVGSSWLGGGVAFVWACRGHFFIVVVSYYDRWWLYNVWRSGISFARKIVAMIGDRGVCIHGNTLSFLLCLRFSTLNVLVKEYTPKTLLYNIIRYAGLFVP